MTPWEYLIVPVGEPGSESTLNDYGKIGWEAVGLTERPGGGCAVLLKRTLPQLRASGGRF